MIKFDSKNPIFLNLYYKGTRVELNTQKTPIRNLLKLNIWFVQLF